MNLIVAINKHGIIGKDGIIPWKCPEDLKIFKETTMNQIVIMGRKTFDSLKQFSKIGYLPNRINIVLTNNKYENTENVIYCDYNSLDDIIKQYEKEVFVIGGAEIFKLLENKIKKMYISIIDDDTEDGLKFPLSLNDYKLLDSEVYDTFVRHICGKKGQ